MLEKLKLKQQQLKTRFDQLTEQIADLQDKQKEIRGAYSVLEELIKAETPEEK